MYRRNKFHTALSRSSCFKIFGSVLIGLIYCPPGMSNNSPEHTGPSEVTLEVIRRFGIPNLTERTSTTTQTLSPAQSGSLTDEGAGQKIQPLSASTPAEADLRSDQADKTTSTKQVTRDTIERYFQQAREAVERGDSQAAIVALETILLFAPELDNIRLELGVLYGNLAQQGSVFANLGEQYDRVGARERAIFYLNKAIASEQIPGDILAQAQQRLDALMTPGGDVFQYFGSITAGVQTESNPQSLSDDVMLFDTFIGSVRTLPNIDDINNDTSFSVAHDSTVQYRTAPNLFLQGDLSLSLRFYNETDSLNQGFVQLKTGPVYFPATTAPAVVRVNPFLTAGATSYDEELFQSSVGGGLRVSRNVGSFDTAVQLTASSVDFDNNTVRDALTNQISASVAYRFPDTGWGLSAELQRSQNSAELKSFSYDELGVTVGASYTIARGEARLPLRISASFNASNTEYDAADEVIDPGTVRSDDKQSVRANLLIPITSDVGFNAYVSSTNNESSIENYTFKNQLAGVNATWRF